MNNNSDNNSKRPGAAIVYDQVVPQTNSGHKHHDKHTQQLMIYIIIYGLIGMKVMLESIIWTLDCITAIFMIMVAPQLMWNLDGEMSEDDEDEDELEQIYMQEKLHYSR